MSRKLLTAALGLFALTVFAGTAFVPTSSASPGHASRAASHKPDGLTAQGLANARESGMPSHWVTMRPQSSLKLLSRATQVGPHAARSTIELTVGLKLRNTAKLKSFLQQVQNPASPVYYRWLTPKEFTLRYGPSKADVVQVVQFLKAHGITVKDVSPNRILIHTEAATETYARAFGVEINDYKLNGRRFYSTTDSPKLPRAIAPLITNILGLNHGVQAQPHHFMKPLEGAAAGGMSPNAARPPASLTNLNPLQIAHAYDWPDITDAANGGGASVAILTAVSSGVESNASPHIFWGVFGLPDHTINVIPVDGNYGNTEGMGETLLDIEMSGAMGPGATLNVYVAADRYLVTFAHMYNRFVNDDDSAVMTTSWGYPEILAPELAVTNNQIFMQAAAQGISMFAAAGDLGSSDGTNQNIVADFPSSSPYITAANGTQLTIADRSGTYGSEIVWNDGSCFNQGPASTGGAISRLFEKPGWQRGPGVPAGVEMRMNSGLALTASCSHPMLIYQNGSWYIMSGTSAVAPQLAGLFAIAVTGNGGRLGQSNSLIYDHANVNYASDFHDVTAGNNGAFEAGPGWDHPTGWGSVNATSLLSHIAIPGAKGTLKGTVSDAASGLPVAKATIKVGDQKIVSADDGGYSTTLPAGDVTVIVSAFGYEQTSATAHIGDGDTVTQDFALAAAPTAVLSGKVTDGSGHGYGLYADIKVNTANFRQAAEVWTDPQTGRYSVELPKGFDYTIHVAAALDGYIADSKTVTLAGDKTRDFALTAASTCSAPGYTFSGAGGFSQDFNGPAFPPAGWSVTNADNGNVVWTLASHLPWDNGNYTGGTGDAASADSSVFNQDGSPYDTSLVTPPISVAGLPADPVLKYKANYQTNEWTVGDKFDLDISTDGGAHWTNVLHWHTDHGTFFGTPGANVQAGLAPYLPASGDLQLRWRYSGGGQNLYAQLDDVVIGSCTPLPGSLVMGRATDANTGESIAGVHVEDEQSAGAYTVINPTDRNSDHPNPLYMFFASQGTRTLTATSSNYATATVQVQVPDNQVVRKDFSLKAARLETDPGALTLHVPVGNSATASFALKNTGGGTGSFRIFAIDSPPATGEGQAVVNVPVKHPAWLKASPVWVQAQINARARSFAAAPKAGSVAPRADQPGEAWRGIASYPPIFEGSCSNSYGPCLGIAESTAARDPATGKIYSMGGFTKVNGTNINVLGLNLAYVYDPGSSDPVWTPIADAPIARLAPVSAFVNGKFYVFNGWDGTPGGNPAAEVDIYDSATNTWSQGTVNPVPAAGGSAGAVLNGQVYIVGGCNNGSCTVMLDSVQVYNPVSDSWHSAADYPTQVNNVACGGINGKLYCAGGVDGASLLAAGFVYDPVLNSWAPIAPIPVSGLSGSYYTAANGLLMMAGGLTTGGVGSSITNRAVAYDPNTDAWLKLPPLNQPVVNGASACGFYGIGGIVATSDFFGNTITANSVVLPGYDRLCGAPPAIPWLAVTPTSGTLNADDSATVALSFDGAEQEAFTTSEIYLSILNNTPYGALTVPVTVHWDPRPVDLVLTGSASPSPVAKGGNLVYTLSVENQQAEGHGAATETTLLYTLPDGASYVSASGEGVSCAPPSAGSSSAPMAASTSGALICTLGTLDPGAAKTVTIAIEATEAGTLTSHFAVMAREPNDSDKSALDISTTVIGTADLALSTQGTPAIDAGGSGTLAFTLTNTGPDAATDVGLTAPAVGVLSYQSAEASQGSCAIASGKLACDIGEVADGDTVTVTLHVFGAYAGTGTVNAQATTTSTDPDTGNNNAQAEVTVKAAGNGGGADSGGGGGLGWLALAALFGLALVSTGVAKGRNG